MRKVRTLLQDHFPQINTFVLNIFSRDRHTGQRKSSNQVGGLMKFNTTNIFF